MRFHPVILCGGAGTRLWPASRNDRPKQFLPLLGELSLFQETVLRLAGLDGVQTPVVVTGASHLAAVTRQMADLGRDFTALIEPEGRDSAAALAAATAWIAAIDPDGVAVALASDHHIPDAGAFCEAVMRAGVAAAGGAVVTFGVRPTSAATAYGYIQPGDDLEGAPGVQAVRRFVEKPDAPTAQAYVADGYLWNSGNFVFRAASMAEDLARHAPDVLAAARAALAEAGAPVGGVVRLGPAFRTAPKISIDYAVMEKTDRAAVMAVSFDWSDVGAWDAVWAALPHDADGNSLQGRTLMVASRDSLVRVPADGPLVVGVGLERIGVVVEGDAILVCDLGSSQGVKLAVDRLKAEARAELVTTAPIADLGAVRDRMMGWLNASALPLWWALGADHEGGGFHEALDQAGAAPPIERRLRVQARQIYVYATAAAMGWPGPWRTAVGHGLDALLTRYRRPDGLFRPGSDADEVMPVLYDQAFCILALCAASQALPERRPALQAAAEQTLATLQATRAHAGGGFTESEATSYYAPGGQTAFYANPHMHLFEAALAWAEVGGGAAWEALADALAELCLSRFIDADGALHEWFDADWRFAPGLAGHIVEPGHQFEWAWLLERWSRRRGRADAHEAARRLFAVGERGVDRTRGVAVAAMLDDQTTVQDQQARLWSQTEWMKAGLILAEAETDPVARTRQLAAAEAAAAALCHYLDTPIAGLWRDKLDADGRFREEPAPASSLYHIICALKDLRDRAPG